MLVDLAAELLELRVGRGRASCTRASSVGVDGERASGGGGAAEAGEAGGGAAGGRAVLEGRGVRADGGVEEDEEAEQEGGEAEVEARALVRGRRELDLAAKNRHGKVGVHSSPHSGSAGSQVRCSCSMASRRALSSAVRWSSLSSRRRSSTC